MKYAVIDNGSVANIIALNAANAADFPGAVNVSDRPVAIGDSYADGVFTRAGEPVLTDAERVAALEAALAEADTALLDATYDSIVGGAING